MADSLLPPVVAVLTANIVGFKAGMLEAKASLESLKAENSGMALSQATSAMTALGVAAVGVGAITVKMAADFEQATNRLITSAGESQGAIEGVRNGILDMAGQVGFTAQQLATAMYTVDSAGFHAADSLTILKASAEGAKIEQADLGTTVDAVTTSLVDYHLGADQAATVMSKLVAAVGEGKTTLQDLAGSLHSVTPLASNLGISLDEVTAAVATMTVHGMSADQATQNLADTIRHLSNPTQTMISEMGQLGLSSQTLSKELSDPSVGLHGVLDQIYTDILSKMGPAGTVLLGTFKQSASAGADLNQMLQGMPPQLQNISKQLVDGTISFTDYKKEVNNLPEALSNLGKQFETTFNNFNGFSDALKAGSPAAQTFEAALAKIMGDSTGLNTALMLGGENAGRFADNIKTVAGATADASGNVKNWSDVQATLNQKLSDVEGSVSSLAVKVGNALLPMVKNAVDGINGFIDSLNGGTKSADGLAKALEGLGEVGLLGVIGKFVSAAGSVTGFSSALGAAAGPIGILITGGIAGLLHDVPLVGKAFDDSKGSISGFFQAWGKDTQNADGSSQLALDLFGEIPTYVKGAGDAVDKWASGFSKDMDIIGKAITDSDIGKKIGNAGVDVAKAIDGIKKSFQDADRSSAGSLADMSKSVTSWASGVMKSANDAAGALGIPGAMVKIGTAVNGLNKQLGDLGVAMATTINKMSKDVESGLGDIVKNVGSAEAQSNTQTASWMQTMTDTISKGMSANDKSFNQGFQDMINLIAPSMARMSSGINAGMKPILDIFNTDWNWIKSSAQNFFSGAGTWLVQAGRNIVDGLANGITSAIGAVGSAIGSVTQFIRDHLPHSPAKIGPLSGSGSPDIAGRTIGTMLASGISSSSSTVGSAMVDLLNGRYSGGSSAYAIRSGGGYGGGSTNLYATLYLDSRELKNAIQRQTLREERVNTSNGLSRTFSNR